MIPRSYIVPLLILVLASALLVFATSLQLPAAHLEEISQGPSRLHPFGTSAQGRDLFALSLLLMVRAAGEALWATMWTVLVGSAVGLTGARVAEGMIDRIQMGIGRLLDSISPFVLAVCFSAIAPRMLTWQLGVMLAFVAWPSISNVIRTEALRASKLVYVEAARSVGVGPARLAFHHLLPEMLDRIGPLVFGVYLGFVGIFGALDFIGARISADQSLGFAMFDSTSSLRSAPWYFLTCFTAFVALVLGSATVARAFRVLHKRLGRMP